MQKIPKELTKKLLELINDYSKVEGHKINIQKSISFLYISNERVEFESKNTILFTLAPKNETLRYKSTKYVQGLY